MTCFHPRIAWRQKDCKALIFNNNPKYDKLKTEELQIPCGKCIGCILDRCNDTATRCWCEMQDYKQDECCFITITYNDENLGEPWLNVKDEQDFWKRLRYYYPELKIKYMGCGEYGPKTFRKHWHFCVWGYKPKDLKFYKYNHNGDKLYTSKELKEIWGNGFVIIGDLTYKSACYVARYCTKKLFQGQKQKKLKELGLKPEFTVWSKGIGLKYWENFKDKIIKQNGILIKIGEKVKNRKIPKYYMKKWKESEPYEQETYVWEQGLKIKEQWQKILKETSKTESEYLEMQERKLLEKAGLLRRNNFI